MTFPSACFLSTKYSPSQKAQYEWRVIKEREMLCHVIRLCLANVYSMFVAITMVQGHQRQRENLLYSSYLFSVVEVCCTISILTQYTAFCHVKWFHNLLQNELKNWWKFSKDHKIFCTWLPHFWFPPFPHPFAMDGTRYECRLWK